MPENKEQYRRATTVIAGYACGSSFQEVSKKVSKMRETRQHPLYHSSRFAWGSHERHVIFFECLPKGAKTI